MQAEAASDVALEAGHADAHIGGIAEFLQQDCRKADDSADEDDAAGSGKGIFAVHKVLLLENFRLRLDDADIAVFAVLKTAELRTVHSMPRTAEGASCRRKT